MQWAHSLTPDSMLGSDSGDRNDCVRCQAAPLVHRHNATMAAKGLTESGYGAMAAKPSDWTLRGVVCGPRWADPLINGSGWVAWATGRNGERLQGDGESPHDALYALTVQLRGLSR